ncbi:hypothetical protein [Acidisoma sp. 7E03]
MATTVTLGFVQLQSFEVPAVIHFGGRQRLAVHDLPGGGRVIDVMGGADDDIVFGGVISGDNADTRAQLLDALRISGASVPLSWGEQYFIVIVAEARFDYCKPWWIPYQLRCVVRSNLVYGAVATAALATVGVLSDLAQAASQLDSLPPGLTAAETAVADPDAFTPGTAGHAAALSSLQSVQNAVTGDLATSGRALPGFDLSLTGQSPSSAAAAMTGATQVAGGLATRSAVSAFLGRGLATLTQMGGEA